MKLCGVKKEHARYSGRVGRGLNRCRLWFVLLSPVKCAQLHVISVHDATLAKTAISQEKFVECWAYRYRGVFSYCFRAREVSSEHVFPAPEAFLVWSPFLRVMTRGATLRDSNDPHARKKSLLVKKKTVVSSYLIYSECALI